MMEAEHAAQAHFLITIIAALIPLLIWAFQDADQRLASKRPPPRRRIDR